MSTTIPLMAVKLVVPWYQGERVLNVEIHLLVDVLLSFVILVNLIQTMMLQVAVQMIQV
jgi:hypothetical protein